MQYIMHNAVHSHIKHTINASNIYTTNKHTTPYLPPTLHQVSSTRNNRHVAREIDFRSLLFIVSVSILANRMFDWRNNKKFLLVTTAVNSNKMTE